MVNMCYQHKKCMVLRLEKRNIKEKARVLQLNIGDADSGTRYANEVSWANGWANLLAGCIFEDTTIIQNFWGKELR